MDDYQKREFTGVWMPREVLDNNDLTFFQKVLYCDIASFSDCFMSNAKLAKRYNMSEKSISKNITHLIELGFLIKTGFDGRSRHLSARHVSTMKDTVELSQSSRQHPPKVLGSIPPKGEAASPQSSRIDNTLDNTLEEDDAQQSCAAPEPEGPQKRYIPIDEDGCLVSRERKEKAVPKVAHDFILTLKDKQGISTLDGGNNLSAAADVVKMFKSELVKMGFRDDVDDATVVSQFGSFLEVVFTRDLFQKSNATSMRWIKNNFNKMLNITK